MSPDTVKLKKLLIRALPYILIGLVCTNLGEAWRMAEGANASEKLLSFFTTVGIAFGNPLPSFHPIDLMVGLICGAGLRAAVYIRGKNAKNFKEDFIMAFFNSAVTVLQTLVVALGAGLGIWGAINLLEGYGNDNPGAKSQGMKQLMAGGGVALIGITLVPLLSGLFG